MAQDSSPTLTVAVVTPIEAELSRVDPKLFY
jgi:hypothetical protein